MSNNKNQTIAEAFFRINLQQDLPPELATQAFNLILQDSDIGQRDIQLGAFLSGLMAKGPTLEETIAVLNTALEQDRINPNPKKSIELKPHQKLIGCAGSGKKGIKTMNISTPSMIVASASGAYVVKPGSSSTSSLSGSTDFSSEIGINLEQDEDKTISMIQRTGFGIFSIESLIPNFDRRYGGKFYAPHVLSFAFPGLLSPVKLDGLLYGLSHPNVDLSVDVFNHYGYDNVLVVSCTDDNVHYIDEVGIHGKTYIKGIKNRTIEDKIEFQPHLVLGVPKYKSSDISQGRNFFENIKLGIESVSPQTKDNARRDIVCINAGNLLYMSGLVENIREGFDRAKDTVTSGRAIRHLRDIIEESDGIQHKLERYLK